MMGARAFGHCRWPLPLLWLVVLATWSSAACAAVSLDHSRLIMSEQHADAALDILNEGSRAVLLQLWADQGQADAAPGDALAPVVIDPPLFRLESGRSRSARIFWTGAGTRLPADRESLFWMNVLEVPALPSPAGNRLQIAFRTRIKLFYRPQALPAYDQAVFDRLVFDLVRPAGAGWTLRITNPTPFHQTLDGLRVSGPDATSVDLDSPMLLPFQSLHIPLSATPTAPGMKVSFTVVNDYGAGIYQERRLFVPASVNARR